MKKRAILLGVVATSAFTTTAFAADATGEWLVADRTARINIADCGEALWGVVSWEADPGGVDEKNPDPAKRSRPTLGLPILLGMKVTGSNQWAGQIYNSENGRTYSGGLTLINPDMLRVRGCIFGILCGGENWTRAQVTAEDKKLPEDAACSQRNASR
ncbi:MAG TPA: DUF2147 domain-containing protein [Micropepsaceae bacterium]|nr:DUF2147 domain-containing protein [Micropepsaceae bacterium]